MFTAAVAPAMRLAIEVSLEGRCDGSVSERSLPMTLSSFAGKTFLA